jgi:hypothetical protein
MQESSHNMVEGMMSELKVFSSHLALRFYRGQGWTEELIKSFMNRGQLKFWDDKIGEVDMSYWIGEVGTEYDTDKLIATAIGGVFDFYDHRLHGEDARKYVSEMNWWFG